MGVMKDQAIQQENRTEIIDLTPDKQGYATIAAMFAENIVGQVGREERENARVLIGSVINIAAHLGNAVAQNDEDAVAAYKGLIERFPAKTTELL